MRTYLEANLMFKDIALNNISTPRTGFHATPKEKVGHEKKLNFGNLLSLYLWY